MDLSPDEDNFQGRLLHQAALWDNVELLQELISCGADVNALDSCGRSALHAAALNERSQCLTALCAAGAELDARSDESTGGKTALHIAAERGHSENIAVLLRAGARLTTLDAAGDAPLAAAETHGHRHAAHVLREARDALERERQSQHAALRELITRGHCTQLQQRLAALGQNAELIVNLTPGGANTLLYVASEAGLTSAVSSLLACGADGRAHPVTKYCPLYIACYHGHTDIVALLLTAFPQAVKQETVEKWLPLHAAVIGGHPSIVTQLLEYPYPEHVLDTYTDASGSWQYLCAFDVNARDVSGQSALYVSVALNNLAVTDALLSHTVPATPVQQSEEDPGFASEALSPSRGISLGIHAIVSKLTGASAERPHKRISPVRTDVARGADSVVACAARGGHVRLVARLLDAGADPNASAAPPINVQTQEGRESTRRRSRSAGAALTQGTAGYIDRSGPWTALSVAAFLRHVQVVEVLLTRGAADVSGAALRHCARHQLRDLVAKLLASRAYPDPDYKLNKSAVCSAVFSSQREDASHTYSSMCPSTGVMINWRELGANLVYIRMCWIRQAALRVNSKLSSSSSALLSVTRIDVSNNELRLLPPELFAMLSLRHLNAAQNKLERLPTIDDPLEDEDKKRKKKKTRPQVYTAPALQEVYLQDNRLEELPPSLFLLPALQTLDVSNNKLRQLPDTMWTSPSLRDLNVALNHLRDLPTGQENQESSPVQTPSDTTSQLSSSPSVNIALTQSKSSSRSPSIERSESDALDDEEIPTIGNRTPHAVCSEARRAHVWRGTVGECGAGAGAGGRGAGSALTSLNLAHNQFPAVPHALACRAPNLTRLNMAYNSLRSMSYVTSYPTSLRQLDLSHNEITCWPSLPQMETFGSTEGEPLACYCVDNVGGSGVPRGGRRPRSGGSVRDQLLSAACPARRHLRLEALRTLILANNLLTRVQLTTDDDGHTDAADEPADDDDEWTGGSVLKGRLLFPLLSMLDVSCNLLKCLPPHIHDLTNLSVLNISGNKDITDLPPQMGLLSRLWNLNTVGCSLSEPLRSMVSSGRYKSMDIVGYLKSVLQEARPYARMKLMFVGVQSIGKTSLLECLRQESAIQHRRKPTEHWAKRMGNKSTAKGNVSTVGVDIGTWVYDKQRSSRGPVTFRTWDFGGQQEYYATHQYFLSRRSLYLVVWKVTDGRKGLAGAIDWLRSIQARAPGSPVIMVATHYDQVPNVHLPENESPESLQRLIRTSIMGAPDADKLGLPRVLDSLEVSCSSRHNIRLLADIIYSVAYSVKPPGSKEPLLEQRVPATYLALEECVTSLASDLLDPVLRHEEYKRLVTQYMQQNNKRMFRDAAELHQATMFLHENGVLLHYDDATLKELYFLKPQWLCDVLAHVVTVREINPFANNGIMKVEDLAHVFKASPLLAAREEASSLGVSLLNKFELALCWDSRLLLVPPLLPPAPPALPQVSVRSRGWGARRGWPAQLAHLPDTAGTDSPTLIQEVSVSVTGRGGSALRRLLLLSYVPCGFWSRLCARLLADQQLADAPGLLYKLPPELEADETVSKALELSWGWKLWKSGAAASCGSLEAVAIRQLPPRRDLLLPGETPGGDDGYQGVRFVVQSEGAWGSVEAEASACIEVLLPAQVCVVRREDGLPLAGYQSISLEPNPEVLAKMLALVSDHVDLLLEDWYPALGTRFVHTSEGRCLITRIVPCPDCMRQAQANDQDLQLAQEIRRLELAADPPRRARVSEESRASDGDSGVGAESNASSRLGSVEGPPGPRPPSSTVCAWTVEQCVLAGCTAVPLACPAHGHVPLANVAPDCLLLDVEESARARWEHVTAARVAGRGAFGVVLAGTWRAHSVAVKALQPVPPPGNDHLAMQAYKASLSRWQRDPAAAACRAYCALRQELSVLLPLRHAHVAPLLAVCAAPLALLLHLAPLGSLDGVLRSYRSLGARCGAGAARALALQVARALEYLHARRIVYRDLKSENVLVWKMPPPGEDCTSAQQVHVKLGDYGISRLAPPSGTKGFGGTEGFMAPEIMRYNGEEEYNEKVDCFSYGMLLYEIVTTRLPFEGHEAVKEAVLEGARPSLSPRELQYPCTMLESMRRCWAGAPGARPCAAALVSICAAPEYATLCDAAAARTATAGAALAVRGVGEEEGVGWEVWYGGGEPERAHTLLTTTTALTHHHTIRIPLPPDKAEGVCVTAMCRVGNKMWLGDSLGRILVYNASTLSESWRVCVQEAVGGSPSGVCALVALPTLSRVAVALTCGRLFLVTSQRPEAEGSFVLHELGAATQLCALAALILQDGCEVWAGGAGLFAYKVNSTGVCAADQLDLTHMTQHATQHTPVTQDTKLTTRVTLLAASEMHPFVIAYLDPGVCIYQYRSGGQQTSRLDCSKLVPCSESLQSIALDEHLARDKCRVTSLCCQRGCVYVGTVWGCVVVADVTTLRPVTVFRPYEQDVRVIVPLPPRGEEGGGHIATFGNGYRPLLQRFAPQSSNTTTTYNGYYCLLWRCDHWLPD